MLTTLSTTMARAIAFLAAQWDGQAAADQMKVYGYGVNTVAALIDRGLVKPGVVSTGNDIDSNRVRIVTLTDTGYAAAQELTDQIRTGIAVVDGIRFQAVRDRTGEYEIRDYATPSGDLPYTVCPGFHGNDPTWVERTAWEAAHRLNSGEDTPDPIWYQPA